MPDEIYVNTGTSFQQPFNDRTPIIVTTAVDAQRVAQAATNTQQPYPYTANAQQSYTANAQQPYPYIANKTITYPYIANSQTSYIANRQDPFPYIANRQVSYQAALQQPYPYTAVSQTPYIANAQQSYPYTANNQQPYIANAQQPYPYIANTDTQTPSIANRQTPYPYTASAQATYTANSQTPYPYIANQPTTYPYIANSRQPSIVQVPSIGQQSYTADAQQPYPYTASAQSPSIANAQQPYPYTANTRSPSITQTPSTFQTPYIANARQPSEYSNRQPAEYSRQGSEPANGTQTTSLTVAETEYWNSADQFYSDISFQAGGNWQFTHQDWYSRMTLSNSSRDFTWAFARWNTSSGSNYAMSRAGASSVSPARYAWYDQFKVSFPSGGEPTGWSVLGTRSDVGSGISTSQQQDQSNIANVSPSTDYSYNIDGTFYSNDSSGYDTSRGFRERHQTECSNFYGGVTTKTVTYTWTFKFRKTGYPDITIFSGKKSLIKSSHQYNGAGCF